MRHPLALKIVAAAVLCVSGQLCSAAEPSGDALLPAAAAVQQRAIKHNPFSKPDLSQRRQQPVVEEQEPAPQALLQLRAVLYSATAPLVNINGRILAVGEEVEGFLLQEVIEDGAILSKDDVQIMLSMTQE